ncbi:RING-H2 finger protein ATL79-like [Phragmites australis]|uniref:RING-H2 finger protein ATL79-like n=1 Tax=Phragmites australis TaxID=29695 RepID=UPI002D77E681|nr:RING-H2 finger protein ATL79-like [Phragmites australis]
MAMAPQEHDQHHAHRPEPNNTQGASTIATNKWGPYSGAGDFASNMAVILTALLAALALALALNAAVRYLLRRGRGRHGGEGSRERDNANADPEKPAVAEPEAPPALVYSAAGTKLAGAAAECAICLAEFVDGDAVRVMPACGHGFHARCIERWLAGGRRSSCPTCRAPAAAPATAAGASQAEAAAS